MASPRSKRRLFGIDRSGPPPSVTRRGAPLHPWTIPNLVGYLRLAAIPVFCVLAFSSDDGRDPAAALLYLAIAAGDYLDGFLARATGQYSRMGALLDPVVDRLTVLAGAAVCWHFELLPRWALAGARRARGRHPGAGPDGPAARASTSRSTGSGGSASSSSSACIFWAMVLDWWIIRAAFVVGVAIAVLATVVLRARRASAVARTADVQPSSST